MSRRNRTNSGMSLARRQRLAMKKRENEVRVLYSRCFVCQEVLAARVEPLLRARLLAHYQDRHPDILRTGGVPILGKPSTVLHSANSKGDPHGQSTSPRGREASEVHTPDPAPGRTPSLNTPPGPERD